MSGKFTKDMFYRPRKNDSAVVKLISLHSYWQAVKTMRIISWLMEREVPGFKTYGKNPTAELLQQTKDLTEVFEEIYRELTEEILQVIRSEKNNHQETNDQEEHP